MMAPQPSPAVRLDSFGQGLRIAVIGASGGIGGAFVQALEDCDNVEAVYPLSRGQTETTTRNSTRIAIDLEAEASIAAAAAQLGQRAGRLNLVLVATGILHDGDRLQPEKSWRALSPEALDRTFRLNATGPALVAKHFLPLLAKDRKSAFAALSARVGSITDNELGGWHAYCASKAALNMLIKTLSIELARRHPQALCVGLHPGTVDAALSSPFQSGVPEGRLFSPQTSARHLLRVLDNLTPEDSGGLYAWDGSRIPY